MFRPFHSIRSSGALLFLALLLSLNMAQAAVHTYEAVLDGFQPVPPTNSPGTGFGTFVIDDVANTVEYNITFSGLLGAETVSHIHGFAPPGANAGVLHGLPLGSPKAGTWNYMEAQEANILDGLTYVNIHSSMFPGGEIRGQIIAAEPEGCFLNCPAGDGGLTNLDGSGSKSPDLNGSGAVDIVDFALFGQAFQTTDVCSDFDCSGLVNIVDFALFGQHFQHAGSVPGFCQ